MSFVAAAIGGGSALQMGGSIFGGLMGSSAEKRRANSISNAGQKGAADILQSVKYANALSEEKLGVARGDLAPFRDIGQRAGMSLADLLMGGGDVKKMLKASPLFEFQSETGARDINRQLSARGMYGSGAGLETLQRFTTQLIGEEGQRLTDRLMGLTQLGANTAGNMASITSNTGNAMAGRTYGGGVEAANMRYNSTVGAANARASGDHMLADMGMNLFNQAGQGVMQYGNFAMNKPFIDSAIAANERMGMTN